MPAGGLQLICDFNAFYAWVENLHLTTSEAVKKFAVLKEIGSIFIVDAANLKSLVHDPQGRLRGLGTEELLELVALRKDWPKIKRQVEVADCCLM